MKVLPRQIQCRSLFEAQGLSRTGAAAMVGNFVMESGPSLPSAFRSGNLDHGSNGLAQWRLDRLGAYRNFVKAQKPALIEDGMSFADVDKAMWPWYGRMDFQVKFAVKELRESYPALHKKLVAGGDAGTLAADVCWQYERPNKALSNIADRIAWAKAIAADTSTLSAVPVSARSGEPASLTIVDHLHAAADTHEKKAGGGIMAAFMGFVGAIALIVSNFMSVIPTWEWVVIAVLALLMIAGVSAALNQRRSADAIRLAAAGVAKVPEPPAPAPSLAEQIAALSPDTIPNAAVQRAKEAGPLIVNAEGQIVPTVTDPGAPTYAMKLGS